jgi:type I restriction enzyme S subunit
LFDVCDLINGRAFKPTEWSDTGLPIIRIENLNNETAAFNYCNFQVQYKYMVESGDLLISWSGTPGTSFGIFEWLRGRAVLNQHIFRVVLSRGINKSYFYYAYGNLLDEMIKQSHGGVGLQHITRRDLRQFKLLLMGEKEQAEIANRLSAVDGLIAEETELHAKLKLLRNGLMRDLLSGKVRVSALMN